MKKIPSALRDVATEFDSLPGIGPRAALRYAYWLATQPRDHIRRFGEVLARLANDITLCGICGTWAEGTTCEICRDSQRDQTRLCVVATSQDLRVIEESDAFRGRYHVLGGLIDPIEGRTPDMLRISQLVTRVSNPESPIKEIILAFDPDVSGDTTASYLLKRFENLPVTVSRLARGLPTGAQLEYADGNTIADAINNRRS
ncbi:MAG: recombination mediator RecR [bacterium]|nr:recombination mediator RecR [bacterium]